jgi:DegV family protein with EDD domain
MSTAGPAQARIRIVTDSTASLPPELVAQYGITVVPLHVHFGTTAYAEGVTLTTEQFYRLLGSSAELPTTSAPSAGQFIEVYTRLRDECDGIVSIHLNSQWSATYAAAVQAREQVSDIPIAVIDSRTAALGEGMLAVYAARAACEGRSLDEIVRLIHDLIPKMHVVLTVETLEYLRRGGRIGGAQALLGTLLRIRPVLEVRNARIEVWDRVRTMAKTVERLIDYVAEHAQGRPLAHASVLHAAHPAMAEELARRLEERFVIREFYTSAIGPVIGTHLGPGAFGITFHTE